MARSSPANNAPAAVGSPNGHGVRALVRENEALKAQVDALNSLSQLVLNDTQATDVPGGGGIVVTDSPDFEVVDIVIYPYEGKPSLQNLYDNSPIMSNNVSFMDQKRVQPKAFNTELVHVLRATFQALRMEEYPRRMYHYQIRTKRSLGLVWRLSEDAQYATHYVVLTYAWDRLIIETRRWNQPKRVRNDNPADLQAAQTMVKQLPLSD